MRCSQHGDTPKVTRQHSSLKMPRNIAKTATTRGKGTHQNPQNQDKGNGAPPRGLHQTRQQNCSISHKRTREADEPTSKRPRKNSKETTNGRVTTRTRANAQNTQQQPYNDHSEQQQTPRAAPAKRRQPSRSLTEADIPWIVDAFIEAQDKHRHRRQIQDTDEEVYYEDEDSSVSLEDPSADEEFSSEDVAQYVLVTQLDICIVIISICACYVYACLCMSKLACCWFPHPSTNLPVQCHLCSRLTFLYFPKIIPLLPCLTPLPVQGHFYSRHTFPYFPCNTPPPPPPPPPPSTPPN